MANMASIYRARIKLLTSRNELENHGIICKLKRKLRKIEKEQNTRSDE